MKLNLTRIMLVFAVFKYALIAQITITSPLWYGYTFSVQPTS